MRAGWTVGTASGLPAGVDSHTTSFKDVKASSDLHSALVGRFTYRVHIYPVPCRRLVTPWLSAQYLGAVYQRSISPQYLASVSRLSISPQYLASVSRLSIS